MKRFIPIKIKNILIKWLFKKKWKSWAVGAVRDYSDPPT